MASRPARGSWNEEAGEFEPLPTYLELALAAAAATAHDMPEARKKGSFFSRLSSVEKLVAFAIVGLALYGFALIGDGFFLKARADLVDGRMTGAIQQENTKPLSPAQ